MSKPILDIALITVALVRNNYKSSKGSMKTTLAPVVIGAAVGLTTAVVLKCACHNAGST